MREKYVRKWADALSQSIAEANSLKELIEWKTEIDRAVQDTVQPKAEIALNKKAEEILLTSYESKKQLCKDANRAATSLGVVFVDPKTGHAAFLRPHRSRVSDPGRIVFELLAPNRKKAGGRLNLEDPSFKTRVRGDLEQQTKARSR